MGPNDRNATDRNPKDRKLLRGMMIDQNYSLKRHLRCELKDFWELN